MGINTEVWFGTALSLLTILAPAQPVAASHIRIPTKQVRVLPTITRLQPTQALVTPTNRPLPSPTRTPTPTPHIQKIGDEKKTTIIAAINAYRTVKGLPSVSPDPYTCNFANLRAKEIAADFSHEGFKKRQTSNTLPYPHYAAITENIAYTKDYTHVVDLWINSPSHALNMERDTPYVCVENFGDYYAYEGWKP